MEQEELANLFVRKKKGVLEMKQYKVLTQKDKVWSGKFNPSTLEQALNAYAEQGWRLISIATADFGSFARQEFIAVLERDV